MSAPPRTAVVTGASSGIGRATVAALVAEGFHVLAGVRRDDDAAALLHEFGQRVTPLQLDVTDAEQVAEAVRIVHRHAPHGLSALVNNAGVGAPAPMELTEVDEIRHLMEVNAIGPMRLIQALLPALRRGGGRIVNLSSMNGVLSLPMTGAYSASKFALEAMSDALRVELMAWRVPVIVIRPGQVRTPIFNKARADIERRQADMPAALAAGYKLPFARTAKFNERGEKSPTPPETVARVIVKALTARRPRRNYYIGWDALGMRLLRSLMPARSRDRLLARAIGTRRRLTEQPVEAPAQSPAASASGASIGP